MKLAIIGGGIAGLALAALLRDSSWDLCVFERSTGEAQGGHAFLIHRSGLEVLRQRFPLEFPRLLQQKVERYSLRDVQDQEIMGQELDGWVCLKRRNLRDFLLSLLPPRMVTFAKEFSHFICEEGGARAAVFTDGSMLEADLFIGADGARSAVRGYVSADVAFSAVEVKEILGLAPRALASEQGPPCFVKYERPELGVNFGQMPSDHDEMIWFLQYDARRYQEQGKDAEAMRALSQRLAEHFPSAVQELVASSDFSRTYIWKTQDFDALARFHETNIALIGDAAHLALPFTSAGTTNALLDAELLSRSLLERSSLDAALQNFSSQRAPQVAQHLAHGRRLKQAFLSRAAAGSTGVPLASL